MINDSKLEINNISNKKDNKFMRNITLVVMLFIFGAILFNIDNPIAWFEGLYPSSTVTKEETPEPENKLIQEALENNYSAGAEPPILNFAPEETPEEKTNEASKEIEVVNPYAEIVEKEIYSSDTINPIIIKRKVDEYRLYLANAHKLIDKFYADEAYDLELQGLKVQQLPAKLEELISLLDVYNQLLMNKDVKKTNIVKPFDSKLLTKLVTVKKIPAVQLEKIELKNEIKEHLNVLTNYIFSSELMDSFLNK